MSRFKRLFQQKDLLCLSCVQAGILFIAMLIYLANRGKAFTRSYAPEDYTLSCGTMLENSVRIGDADEQAGSFLSINQPLEKGNYIIQVNYSTNSENNTIRAYSSDLSELEILTAPAALDPHLQTASLTIDLLHDTDDLMIEAGFCGEGYLEILQMGVYETSAQYKRNVFYALLLCIVLEVGYLFLKADLHRRKIMFGLTAIFLTSCYPLFVNYMLAGHDLPFHLLRIEGIYKGLSQGVFPVKIHPVWSKDYGYAVGVFYGDAALYFPAFLRMMGLSVQQAYKWFVAAINLGTVLISYHCFKRMFRSDRTGLLGCLLYTLSLYRLSDVYTRASVGEYTAMMFFPLVLCGFYLIYTSDTAEPQKGIAVWGPSVLIAAGLSGIVQSHVLSCEMTAFFILLTCIILFKRTFRPRIFMKLAGSAILTVLMNIGFLIPFFDYFDSSIKINSPEWVSAANQSIQSKGLFPVQLFTIMQHSNGGTWATTAGVYNEATYSLGIALTVGMLLFLYLISCYSKNMHRRPNYAAARLCCILSILSLFMCTCYFPWDSLADSNPAFYRMITSLEFPWRLLSIATILTVFVTCYAAGAAKQIMRSQNQLIPEVILILLLAVNCGWYYYDFTFTGEPYRVYDTYELNTMSMYSYDYLPTGTDPEKIQAGTIYLSGDGEIVNYDKEGTSITCDIITAKNGGTVDFPLNYYKHYKCLDSAGKELQVSPGYNNMLRVTVPPNYSGNLSIRFSEPWFWRAGELLSGITMITVLCLCIKGYLSSQKVKRE